jgi:hypothetical protein
MSASATSRKLDYLDALAADPTVPPRAFEIGFAIVQRCRWEMEPPQAQISDLALLDRTGSCLRDLTRHRATLRKQGWIVWRRTASANIYTPLFEKVATMMALLEQKAEVRRERGGGAPAKPARCRLRPAPARTPESKPDWTPALDDQTQESKKDRTPVAKIHLSHLNPHLVSSPCELTVKEEGIIYPAICDEIAAMQFILVELGEGDKAHGRRIADSLHPDLLSTVRKLAVKGKLRKTDIAEAVRRAEAAGLTKP